MRPTTRTRVLVVTCLAALAAGAVAASPPEAIATQGKLLDAGGIPVVDGDYALTFRFHDACTGGQLLLEDAHPAAPVVDGIYSVLLGSGTLTPGVESTLGGVFANHDTVCLGLSVNGDAEMTPRTPLVSAGYALRATTADHGPGGGTLVEASADVVWTGDHTYEGDLTFGAVSDLVWPHVTGTVVPDAQFRIIKYEGNPPNQDMHPNQELDEQWMICYNCTDEGVFQRDPTQHAWNQKIEATYWDGVRESLEYNWNYTNPFGNRWRPFAFRLFIDGTCSDTAAFCTDDDECNPGATCDGSNRASFVWNTRPGNDKADLELQHGSGTLIYRRGLFGEMTYLGSKPNSVANETEHYIELATGTATGTATAFLASNNFQGDDSGAALTDMFASRALNHFVGTAPDRAITGKMIAFDARNEISQTGTTTSVGELYGFRYRLVPTGTFTAVGQSAAIFIDSPSALDGVAPVTFDRHDALRIRDQRGLGATRGAAIVVDAQDAFPSPERGNVVLEGGGWNDGHLELGAVHVWSDDASGQVRLADVAPTGSGAGGPIHAPRGTAPDWGTALWCDGSEPSRNTGDEVCAAAGMTCRDTYPMGSATSVPCGSTQNGTVFLAFCY